MIKHLVNVAKSLWREQGKANKRSPHWPAVEKAHKKANPTCAACGSRTLVQVHHCQPFHLHPELELDPANLISACMSVNECHLRICHGDSFKMWNPDVRKDCADAAAGRRTLAQVAEDAKAKRRA